MKAAQRVQERAWGGVYHGDVYAQPRARHALAHKEPLPYRATVAAGAYARLACVHPILLSAGMLRGPRCAADGTLSSLNALTSDARRAAPKLALSDDVYNARTRAGVQKWREARCDPHSRRYADGATYPVTPRLARHTVPGPQCVLDVTVLPDAHTDAVVPPGGVEVAPRAGPRQPFRWASQTARSLLSNAPEVRSPSVQLRSRFHSWPHACIACRASHFELRARARRRGPRALTRAPPRRRCCTITPARWWRCP